MEKYGTSFKPFQTGQRMMPKRFFLFLLVLLASPVSGFAPAFAAEAASEQSVRAALVFNFIKFTEWPAAAEGNPQLRVCIASNDPVQLAALEALNERLVRGKPLAALRFRRQADCDVIYADSRQRWNEILEQTPKGRALTIGGYPGFAANGGMIEISLQEGSARFDINLLEAKRAGLRIYPQLLRLARRVLE